MAYMLTSTFSLGFLLVYVYAYRKWSAYSRFRTAAIRHGCRRPRKYPHRDPLWGYDLYLARAEATRRGHLLRLHERLFSLCGKTFEERCFNEKVINTMETANIH